MRRDIPMIMVFVLSVFLIGCQSEEASMKEEIYEANYCDSKDDCVHVGSKCPFGCYIYANSNEAERIKEKVDGYESNCQYSCIECRDVECKDNKCSPICA